MTSRNRTSPEGGEVRSGTERRAYPRYPVQLEAGIEIILPEETFQPHQLEADVFDISMRGMRLVVHILPNQLFRRMIPKIRYARIKLNPPEVESEIKITGKIMWYDYHSEVSVTRQPHDCDVGVLIDPSETQNIAQYEALVEAIAKRVGS